MDLINPLLYIQNHVFVVFIQIVDVHGFKGSRFHSRPRTAFGMCIYEKSVIFVMPKPKIVHKLTITWENKHF